MARRCRDVAWSSTPLGSTENWSVPLQVAVRSVLASPFPIALWCGPSLSLIYNEAYGTVLGSKHPWALGRPAHEVWREIWPTIEGVFRSGAAGTATYAEDSRFEISDEDGTLREAWFTFAVSPVRDEAGEIVAFLNPAMETTRQIAAERELHAARDAAVRAEHRIREVLAQAPAFLAVLRGHDHRFEYANDAYGRLVGHRTLIGRSVADALPEVREQGFVELLDRVYSTGTPWVGRAIPMMLERIHGEAPQQLFVDFVFQPLAGADGSIEGIVAHGADVTDAVKARTVIEENASKFRFLADSIPVQVWTATTDGLLDYVNLRAETFFGAPASALVGTGWQSYVHPEDLVLAGGRWAHSLATGAPYEVEFRLRGADDTYRWHLARGTAQRSTEGEILRWFGTNTDIEDAKRNEAELHRLTQEATEANRAKGDFLAAMSHELRTPLNAIGGYAQLIEMGVRGPVTDAIIEDLRKIQRSKEHLNTLVGSVLAFAKGGTGRIELQTRDVRVDSLLHSVLDMIAPQLAERGLLLDPVEGECDIVFRADEDKARQVLLNVLANALKFTPTGGHITISVASRESAGLIAVRDTGIGVAPEQLEAIFEPFVQAGSALESRDSGVGLGLAISRQLARAMGGDLTVQSVKGSGSTFTLELPLRA